MTFTELAAGVAVTVSLATLASHLLNLGRWGARRESSTESTQAAVKKLQEEYERCVQVPLCDARQANIRQIAERAHKVAHDAREAVQLAVNKMEEKFIPRETVELKLEAIDERLGRMEKLAADDACAMQDRLLSIEQAIRSNGKKTSVQA